MIAPNSFTRVEYYEPFLVNGETVNIKWTAIDFNNNPEASWVPLMLRDCGVIFLKFDEGEVIEMSSAIPWNCQDLSALHEHFCHASAADHSRCAEVEKWIVDSLEGTQRSDYVRFRIKMFSNLIDFYDLPNVRESTHEFTRTLNYLKSLV